MNKSNANTTGRAKKGKTVTLYVNNNTDRLCNDMRQIVKDGKAVSLSACVQDAVEHRAIREKLRLVITPAAYVCLAAGCFDSIVRCPLDNGDVILTVNQDILTDVNGVLTSIGTKTDDVRKYVYGDGDE